MSGKPTPGPWEATCVQSEDHGPEFWLIDACPFPNGETAVAELCVGKAADRTEANARLIAAAPDLLTALETVEQNTPLDVLDYLTDGIGSPSLRDVIRAAIKKAKGE